MNKHIRKYRKTGIKHHKPFFKFIRSLFKSKGMLNSGLLFVGVIMSVLVLGSFSITGYAPALPYEKPEPTITPTPTIAPPFALPSDYGKDKDDRLYEQLHPKALLQINVQTAECR